MIKTSVLRKSHRVLGVVIGIQLLIWTVSGAIFAWNDIESVRGDDMRIRPGAVAMADDWISPGAIEFGDRLDPERVVGIDLVQLGGSMFYRIEDDTDRTILADVRTGQLRDPLSQEEAIELARESFDAEVEIESATLLTADQVGDHHEYRSGPVPAWVVQLDHPSNTRVYVSQAGAAVTSHRNDTWRVCDFFWMLHTMDYRGRDNFNHLLLTVFSIVAITTASSGLLLWTWRAGSRLRRWRAVRGG